MTWLAEVRMCHPCAGAMLLTLCLDGPVLFLLSPGHACFKGFGSFSFFLRQTSELFCGALEAPARTRFGAEGGGGVFCGEVEAVRAGKRRRGGAFCRVEAARAGQSWGGGAFCRAGGQPALASELGGGALWSSGSAGNRTCFRAGDVRFVEQSKPCGRATRTCFRAEGGLGAVEAVRAGNPHLLQSWGGGGCVLWSSGSRAGGQPALASEPEGGVRFVEQWKPCGQATRTCFRAGGGGAFCGAVEPRGRATCTSESAFRGVEAVRGAFCGAVEAVWAGNPHLLQSWGGCVLWSNGSRAGGQRALASELGRGVRVVEQWKPCGRANPHLLQSWGGVRLWSSGRRAGGQPALASELGAACVLWSSGSRAGGQPALASELGGRRAFCGAVEAVRAGNPHLLQSWGGGGAFCGAVEAVRAGNPHLLQSWGAACVLWSSGSRAGGQPALASELGGGGGCVLWSSGSRAGGQPALASELGGGVCFVEQWKTCGRATRTCFRAGGEAVRAGNPHLLQSGSRAGGRTRSCFRAGGGAFCGAVEAVRAVGCALFYS